MRDGPKLRTWEVKDTDDVYHEITAHFCFDNAEEGLIFRRYKNDDLEERTTVVASFARGFWKFYKETTSND